MEVNTPTVTFPHALSEIKNLLILVFSKRSWQMLIYSDTDA